MKHLGLKALILLAVVALASSILAGCTGCNSDKKASNFTLTGEKLSADLEGKYVYVFSNGRLPIDSALVQDGKFTLVVDSVTTSDVFTLSDRVTGSASFIPEAGKAELRTADGTFADAAVYSVSPENGLNTMITEYSKRKTEIEAPLLADNEGWYQRWQKRDSLPAKEVAALEAEKFALDSVYNAQMNAFYKKEYEANKENVIGALTFAHLGFKGEAGYIEAYEAASEAVREYSYNKYIYELYMKSQKSAVGSPYLDIEMTNDKGEVKKISDLWKKDTYLLIDFWASWCGPCRKAMPHLAGLNKKLGDKLTVLSIGGLQETPEQNQKAMEDLKMDWTTFFDAKSVAADAYGVTAIPNLVLIAPDGTIIERSNDPAAIDAKLKEAGLLK